MALVGREYTDKMLLRGVICFQNCAQIFLQLWKNPGKPQLGDRR